MPGFPPGRARTCLEGVADWVNDSASNPAAVMRPRNEYFIFAFIGFISTNWGLKPFINMTLAVETKVIGGNNTLEFSFISKDLSSQFSS